MHEEFQLASVVSVCCFLACCAGAGGTHLCGLVAGGAGRLHGEALARRRVSAEIDSSQAPAAQRSLNHESIHARSGRDAVRELKTHELLMRIHACSLQRASNN